MDLLPLWVTKGKRSYGIRMKEDKLFIIVPCYNEAESLPSSSGRLLQKLTELIVSERVSPESRILFVDDGSRDRTWELIREYHRKDKHFSGIQLAHNRGHQTALLAGLMFAKDRADMCISIDADLQQDVNAMERFIQKYEEGCDIVYGVRNSRNTDSFFKKTTARIFYKGMKLLGAELYENSADYRLLGKKALQALSEYKEVNIFLRGIIPEIGLKSDVVHFDVFEREFGTSKYTLKKMMKLAVDGITAFSITPIHFIFGAGMVFFLISIVMIIQSIVDYALGNTVPGWATIVCVLWFIGGIQMLAIGIVGEYVGRNYEETKRRPRYFLQDIYYEE
jgi:glycosyltransferase involved in cell wall biosynthesis